MSSRTDLAIEFGNNSSPGNLKKGRVLTAHGRHYMVQPDESNSLLQCFARGKKSQIIVGDRVSFKSISTNQGIIVATDKRCNVFFRSDQFKMKCFAANFDQLLIVLATTPYFSEDLLSRALVAAEAHQLKSVILLNKTDLLVSLSLARERVASYIALGYWVVEVSAAAEADAARARLEPLLERRSTLLLGQSGMGKSTLINLLVPDANATTIDISSALNSGRHTTTFTRWYELANGGALIDSPGFQEFGLYHLTEGQLERAFPEFRSLLGDCGFYNCHHLREPRCAILRAVSQGRIAPARHALYAQLLLETNQPNARRSR
ncbi:ribosome small subunit-dependent GTPase A [Candidatus Vallotia lariciata]|uniref:ribosome small subunit-dependent GTPase A n=1 Tax=Candidatus Vallotia laricis TaxID=2018052 RepID=UPI001D023561|nr:ribosome small subunit-dependent GTPase A [Candidatus Vallotia lariciata]UDG83204.1 Small ribosomal subunit biogenesis GTPase RsgA [Candidatus Vallotia lariciata]